MINLFIIIGAILGFISGCYYYHKFGYKFKEPSITDINFMLVTKYLFGFMGMFVGAFIGLLLIMLLIEKNIL